MTEIAKDPENSGQTTFNKYDKRLWQQKKTLKKHWNYLKINKTRNTQNGSNGNIRTAWIWKSLVSEIAAKKGATVVSIGDIIREEAKKRGESSKETATNLRKNYRKIYCSQANYWKNQKDDWRQISYNNHRRRESEVLLK